MLAPQTCSFTGAFTQSKEVIGLIEPLVSTGDFYYHCEGGVIWKTNSPTSQTLIFRKAGKAFSLQQQTISKLKAAQGKILGGLLNSLIGGNQKELSEQFEISSCRETECDKAKRIASTDINNTVANSYVLKPTKRSLKRGLKEIKLNFINAVAGHPVTVNISMLDRKDQWTHISSIKSASLNEHENPAQQCSELEIVTLQECDLLHDSS